LGINLNRRSDNIGNIEKVFKMAVSTHIRLGLEQFDKLEALEKLLGKTKRKILETFIEEFYSEVVIDKAPIAMQLIENLKELSK